jgi:hypothetical protein
MICNSPPSWFCVDVIRCRSYNICLIEIKSQALKYLEEIEDV